MTATLTPNAKQQFFDANGNPLVGGKLYSYLAGTTTPAVTYVDSAGVTTNTNPIILDSRGEANIWLGSTTLKFKLTSATDVEIWTVDNIVSPTAGVLATLAASSGSSLVGFIQSGTGTVATTVQTKLRESVSVKDFGAVGDGVTDDTAAIATAWVASKYLTFPAGTYKVSALPNFASNGARIETVGKVTINYTGTGNGLIVDAGSGAGVVNYDIQIGPMTIVGSASAQNGVYIRGITHSVFKRLRPINFPLSAMRCEFMVSNTFDEFCYSGNEAGITVFTARGIILEKRNAGEQSSDCTFINPIIEGTTGDGIYAPEAAMCTFVGGTSEGNGTAGGAGAVYLGANSFGNTFIGLDMESNGKAGDATSYHVKNYGYRNKFITPLCDSVVSDLFWVAGGNSLSIDGGQIGSLKIDAGVNNCNTVGVSYDGTITDNGTATRRIQEFFITAATTLADSQITFGTWTPTTSGLTSSTTAVVTATYQKVGRLVYFTIYVTATGGGNTTATSATFSVPFSQLSSAPGVTTTVNNNTGVGVGSSAVFGNQIYTPNWTTQSFMIVSGSYLTAS